MRHKAMGIMWFPDGHNLLPNDCTPLVKALRFGWSPLSEGSPVRCRTEVAGPAVSPQGTLIAHVGGNGHEIWITGQNGEESKKGARGQRSGLCGSSLVADR